MSCLVFCNVGARDVQIREGERLAELRPPRERGKEVWGDYAAYAEKIALPIIEPGLRYILSIAGGEEAQVVLFGTDQPDGEFASTDTLYFAEIAARRLNEMGLPGLRCSAALIQGINPAYYDEAYEALGELLRAHPQEEGRAYYVILAGGTPACNAALLLQGVRRFGQALQAVYVPPRKEPLSLRVGQQIEDSFQAAAALEHLRRLDFANARPYLAHLRAGRGLVELVEYAAQRFDFDFPSARQSLERAIRNGGPPVRAFCAAIRHDLDRLAEPGEDPGSLLLLLEELHWNACITFAHRRYADFLGRVYRLQEAVLRYLVERVYGLSTDLSPARAEDTLRKWEAGVAADTGLVAFLEAKKVDGRPLDWRVIGRPTYKAMLSHAFGPGAGGGNRLPRGDFERLKACFEKVNKLDQLVELRHRTIIGHGFQGVSEKDILDLVPGGRSPQEALADILRPLTQQKMESSVFDRVAVFVIEQMIQEG